MELWLARMLIYWFFTVVFLWREDIDFGCVADRFIGRHRHTRGFQITLSSVCVTGR
jgi:hypothetical protein